MAIAGIGTGVISVSKPMVFMHDPDRYIRPGHYANSEVMGYIGRHTNSVAANRVKVHFCHSRQLDQSVSTAQVEQFRIRFKTGVNAKRVWCTMVLQPLSTHSTSTESYLQWTTTPDGGGTTTHPKIYTESYASSIDISGLITFNQQWDVDPETHYNVVLNKGGYMRWASITIWEPQEGTIGFHTTPVAEVDPKRASVGAEIRQQHMEDIWESQYNIWKSNGATIVNSVSIQSGLGKFGSNATGLNLYSSSFTAWDADAPGHWAYLENKGSLDSDTIPATLWVFGKKGASTGVLSITNSSTTIGTVTMTSGTASVVTNAVSLPTGNYKIDPIMTGAWTVWSWGLYENKD